MTVHILVEVYYWIQNKMKKHQQSIMDTLFDQLEHFDSIRRNKRSASVSDKAASTLYSAWKNQNNDSYNKVYEKPSTNSSIFRPAAVGL